MNFCVNEQPQLQCNVSSWLSASQADERSRSCASWAGRAAVGCMEPSLSRGRFGPSSASRRLSVGGACVHLHFGVNKTPPRRGDPVTISSRLGAPLLFHEHFRLAMAMAKASLWSSTLGYGHVWLTYVLGPFDDPGMEWQSHFLRNTLVTLWRPRSCRVCLFLSRHGGSAVIVFGDLTAASGGPSFQEIIIRSAANLVGLGWSAEMVARLHYCGKLWHWVFCLAVCRGTSADLPTPFHDGASHPSVGLARDAMAHIANS